MARNIFFPCGFWIAQRSARIRFVLICDFDSRKWIKNRLWFLIHSLFCESNHKWLDSRRINWPSESLIHLIRFVYLAKRISAIFDFLIFDFWFWFDLIHSEVGPQSVIVRWVILTRALSLAAGLGLMTHPFHTGSFQKFGKIRKTKSK